MTATWLRTSLSFQLFQPFSPTSSKQKFFHGNKTKLFLRWSSKINKYIHVSVVVAVLIAFCWCLMSALPKGGVSGAIIKRTNSYPTNLLIYMPKDMQYPKQLIPLQMKCRAMQLQLSLNTHTHTHINYALNNRQFQLPQLPELYWPKK